jgi:hypothetical protein
MYVGQYHLTDTLILMRRLRVDPVMKAVKIEVVARQEIAKDVMMIFPIVIFAKIHTVVTVRVSMTQTALTTIAPYLMHIGIQILVNVKGIVKEIIKKCSVKDAHLAAYTAKIPLVLIPALNVDSIMITSSKMMTALSIVSINALQDLKDQTAKIC